MLSLVRRSLIARGAALLAASALSGAPRLAFALVPEPAHRCQCAAHGERHRCACPICAEAARRARAVARSSEAERIESLPPCHREAARRALAASAAEEQDRPVTPGASIAPCCGFAGEREASGSTDPFVVPDPPRLPDGARCERLRAVAPAAATAAVQPEIPPPRR